MNMENEMKNIIIAVLISFLVGLFVMKVIPQETPFTTGGKTEGYYDSAGGYYVDGVVIIDGDGNFDGAITGTSATLSSTLTVTGESNLDTMIQGGDITTLPYSDFQMTAAEMCDSSIIQWGGVTTTVYIAPAADMIADCIPAIGDKKQLMIWNYSTTTTAEATMTLAATTTNLGEENILLEPEDGGLVVIEHSEFAWLEITNINGATTTVIVDALRDAD